MYVPVGISFGLRVDVIDVVSGGLVGRVAGVGAGVSDRRVGAVVGVFGFTVLVEQVMQSDTEMIQRYTTALQGKFQKIANTKFITIHIQYIIQNILTQSNKSTKDQKKIGSMLNIPL